VSVAGLNDLLSIAKGALQTHQKGLNVTGHNIANAATPGYTRQTLIQTEAVPLRTPQGLIGRGVTDNGVLSQRDTFLDAAYRTQQGNFSQSDTLQTSMTQVQTLFNEPGDNGLGSALDTMWGSFGDLANDPSSGSTRVTVQQNAAAVIQQLHSLSAGITAISADANAQYHATIDQVNSIVKQVADLNSQIVAAGGGPGHAGDLADQRGVLLDQLGAIADVRVLDRSNGAVGVIVGDTMMVDGGVAQQLKTITQPGGGLGAEIVGDTRVLTISSGKLAGLNDVMTKAIPQVQGELDTFTASLVATVNTIHASGKTNAGVTGTNFFDPAGVTAATIALAPAIAASPANIVTGLTAASGDNSVALQLAALQDSGVASLGGSSLGDYYSSVVTGLGTTVSNANQAATSAQVISSGLQSQRQSETGVSTDEEMVALIEQQQAFAAAAKIVTVADTLMQTVLDMI
jgi:flagellar hook-associated protein 1